MALIPAAVSAQETSSAMSFIDNAMSPRMSAMGGVSAALEADAYAQFGNIAGMAFSKGTFTAGISYEGWQPSAAGVNTGILGAAYRINDRFSVTLGASASFNRPYDITDEYGISSGQFTPKDWRAGAGVSFLVTESFSAGLGLNYASSSTAPGSDPLYTAFASLQFMYRIRNFSVSLAGNNLGIPVTSVSGEKFNIPMNGELAVSYSNVWGKHGLSAAVDGRMYFGSGIAAGCSIGAEYEFAGLAAVRAGYHFGAESDGLPSFASVGAGLNVFGVSIDAAYIVAACSSPMKNTFSVGIGYEF